MASTVDSGIDTGNDSNDSSLQEKFFKMDFEIPTQLNLSDSIKESKVCAVEQAQEKDRSYSSLKKIQEVHKLRAPPSLSSCQQLPLPESCSRNFNCAFINVINSNELKDTFAGPYGRDYAAKELMTKMNHRLRYLRQALRLRCIRRSPTHGGTGDYTVLDHFRLCRAVSYNNTTLVKAMLMTGMTPNCYDPCRRTPLHLAACMGFADMVKLLLDHGADPNAKDSIGNTPLHLAACTYHVRVIALLLQAGTRLSEKDLAGHSPLQLAITKLNIMHRSVTPPNPALLDQITQVVQMMSEYMKQKEHVEPALLSQLFSVMQVKDPSEEKESNIQDLLSKLSLSSKS